MITVYGRILAVAPDAWLFAPATRLEPDPPLADPVSVPRRLAAVRPPRYGLQALRMAAATWLKVQALRESNRLNCSC
jgi:hypothetical protein